MSKKMIVCLLAVIMFVSSIGMILPGNVAVKAQAADADKLSYDVSLEVKDAAVYKIIATGVASNLNDGDLSTNYQPVYQRIDGGDVYKEVGLLTDSFYMILDFKDVYDLSKLEICWFPTGGRAYKYNVEVSSDKTVWTKVADHSTNTTQKDTISDVLTGNSGRYLRIEILGNYRASDNTSSAYFPTTEITVRGTKQETADKKLSYDVSLEVKDTTVYRIVTNYDPTNLNDGDLSTNYQPVYQRIDGGNVYKEIGLLEDSFYMILDFGAVYDLTTLDICWYPAGGRAYKYNVEVSTDKTVWTKVADHSTNTTQKDTISDVLTGNSGRYLRIEILGNYRASDNTSSAYFPTTEITVRGKEQATADKKLSYGVNLEVKDSATYKIITTYDPANLNDGDLSTNYQPVYQRIDGGNVYKEIGLLADSFYMILDFGAVYDLTTLDICWYPTGGRAYKYNVEVSSDKTVWTKVADHSTNTTQKDTISDVLTGNAGRYLRIEILGNYRASDNTSSAYFPTTEITVKGIEKQQITPPAGGDDNDNQDNKPQEPNTPTGDNFMIYGCAMLVVCCLTVCSALKVTGKEGRYAQK